MKNTRSSLPLKLDFVAEQGAETQRYPEGPKIDGYTISFNE